MLKKYTMLAALLPMMAAAQTVKSPNGNVSLTFSLTDKGQPTYEMSYKGKTVCKPSHLGLELAKDKHASKGMEETDLMDGFSETGSKTSAFDETWKPVWGETSTIRNNYNEMEVNLTQKSSKRNITIRFRVYDYGMGLRYEFPQQQTLNYFVIKEEHTQFAMAGNHTAYWIPGDYDTQEYEYNITPLTGIREVIAKNREVYKSNSSTSVFSDTGVQTSLQLKTNDGLYINIHEALIVAPFRETCLEYARCVVHRTTLQTGERKHHGVVSYVSAECFILSTTCTLIAYKVRPGAADARRTCRFVSINHDVVLGGSLYYALIVIVH
jgi:glucan 1,4-alpha-glucosidase